MDPFVLSYEKTRPPRSLFIYLINFSKTIMEVSDAYWNVFKQFDRLIFFTLLSFLSDFRKNWLHQTCIEIPNKVTRKRYIKQLHLCIYFQTHDSGKKARSRYVSRNNFLLCPQYRDLCVQKNKTITFCLISLLFNNLVIKFFNRFDSLRAFDVCCIGGNLDRALILSGVFHKILSIMNSLVYNLNAHQGSGTDQ